MARTRYLALLAWLTACDAPTREEVAGLQQRLDTLSTDQGALRSKVDGLAEGLRAQQELAATQASALEAMKTELAALQATVATRPAKPEPTAVVPIAAGRPDPAARYEVAVGDSAFRGAEDAKITIVIFSDFQCPFCARVQATLEDVRTAYGTDVRIVAKHNPLAMHPAADGAARAAEAAGMQGKFWEMHDLLYEKSRALDVADLPAYAKSLGLDVSKFTRDMDDKTVRARIDADAKQAKDLGARGTPAFFVNGRYLSGAQPLEAFKTLIDAEILEADRLIAAGTPRAGVYAALMATAKPGVAAATP